MSDFIVRVWFDVLVTGAASKEAALNEARATPVVIPGDYRVCKNGGTVQQYDVQVSGQVWPRKETNE